VHLRVLPSARPRARGTAQATTGQDRVGGRLHGMASRARESRPNSGVRSRAPTDRRQLNSGREIPDLTVTGGTEVSNLAPSSRESGEIVGSATLGPRVEPELQQKFRRQPRHVMAGGHLIDGWGLGSNPAESIGPILVASGVGDRLSPRRRTFCLATPPLHRWPGGNLQF
jgi:hypothetical protein